MKLVQVVHVQGPEALDEACEVAADVDAVLLDSGNLALSVKELGGTGRTHDWDISARIREALPVPMFLAGGLRPDALALVFGLSPNLFFDFFDLASGISEMILASYFLQ